MASEIKDTQDALRVIGAAREIINSYVALINEITLLIKTSAELELDYVSSPVLLDIVQRYILEYQETKKRMEL